MPSEALAEKRKKVAELQKARAEKLKIADEAREDRELDERIKLAELEEKHGLVGRDIAAVFSPITGAMVVVRVPDEVQWQKVNQAQMDGKMTVLAMIELVKSALIYPTPKELEKVWQETPGMLDLSSEAVTALAVGQAKEIGKK